MTSVKQELTCNEIRQLIDYNPETGEMYWKIRHGEHSNLGTLVMLKQKHLMCLPQKDI